MGGPHSLGALLTAMGVPHRRVGGPGEDAFATVSPLEEAGADSLVFVERPTDRTLAAVAASPASVLLLRREWAESNLDSIPATGRPVFLVAQPRLVAGRLLARLHPDEDRFPPGIHPTAVIDPRARLHASVSVGPFCVLGECGIDEGSRIAPFVRVGNGVRIGRRVTVREHAFVGSPGFGIARDEEDGTLLRIPHVGRVVIEDDVEIFPFANVDRGTLTETRIRRGAMIDHYVHVAHNVVVGEDAIVTASSVLCGSSRIGARTWIGVGTLVKEGVSVGDGATTGIGAVVLRDVPPGAVVAGVPARALPSRAAKPSP